MIISDCDSQFVFMFWKTLYTRLKIKTWLLIMHYSETDDQIENVNSIIKQYLWMYCSYFQNNWKRWLSLTEFSVNNMKNESTDVMLFYVTYEQNSWLEFELWIEIDDHDFMIKWLQQINVNNFTDWMNKLTDLLWNEMLYAQTLQEYHVNKEWMLMYDFKSENKIYLST